jgi:hypothetical protein
MAGLPFVNNESPFINARPEIWTEITQSVIAKHPVLQVGLYEIVLEAWSEIFTSTIGSAGLRFGYDFFPSPQVIGDLLHLLVPLLLERKTPGDWRKDRMKSEKDVVYIPNDFYSFEIKSSSSKNGVFGNKSYTAESVNSTKSRSGFYLVVNFDKPTEYCIGGVRNVRFGWLDATDWIGQTSATGQQARLSASALGNKLINVVPMPKRQN